MTRGGATGPGIAVVGWGCVLPGALTPEDLWALARDGRDAVGPAPPGTWGVDPAHVLAPSPEEALDRTWTDRGGYVHGFDHAFDPEGFLLPADEVAGLDPVFLWTLHAGREALRSAGHDPSRREGRAGAVLGNLSYPTPSLARFAASVWWPGGLDAAHGRGQPVVDPRNRFMSGLPAQVLARALGLGAGAWALDAACASSLYAVAQACDWLRSGRADLMLAGGVNHVDDLFLHVGFGALKALSATGRSRPFHRDADGLLPAQGAALVVLKRLEDAVSAGDPILGVIRSVGLSNDGRGGGLLAPSEDGQVRAMQAAYRSAGLRPTDVAFVECHATGTPVGDAVELRSLARVFAGTEGLPLGSLKANLGHLITASGAAALIKVLAALREGVVPPAIHAEPSTPALAGTPFRLPRHAEAWPAGRPRLAALSNFGFGGNNAHLILEGWKGHGSTRSPSAAAPAEDVAVIGLGIRVGEADDAAEVARALFGGQGFVRTQADGGTSARAETIELDLARVRFPPHDLERALPQQLALLAAALQVQDVIDGLPKDRTTVIAGMQCDAEIARSGLRWRLPEDAAALGGGPEWLAAAREAVIEPLASARVVGCMPNIVANRLSAQFDLTGPSLTVSAEQASGTVALELAVAALRRGEVDAAVVGAVDMCCEPVHLAAVRRVLPPSQQVPADAAVVLLLKRAAEARRAGDAILAVLPGVAAATADLRLGVGEPDACDLTAVLGHAHAASGLLHVAAAILAVHRGRRPPEDGGPRPWTSDSTLRTAWVGVRGLGGATTETWLQLEAGSRAVPSPSPAGETRPVTVRSFPAHLPPVRIPLPGTREATATLLEDHGVERMPRAPELPPVIVDDDEPDRGVAAFALAMAPAGAPHSFPERVAEIHARFLHSRALGQERFVAASRHALDLLTSARDAPRAPTVPAQPAEAAPPAVLWGREELRVHACGKLSEAFGPRFVPQDHLAVRVRMPDGPLLLVDRVTRLEAEPGVLGTGSIVTETDVREGAWYLHEGRMPAGLMVEAGQADLLLISWMGIDFHNRGERRYRLLGCDLSFHGELPRPGETLRYEIHVDGHAELEGGVRLFFFHYDCHAGGELRLRVRNGRAGFFSEAELDAARGVLWDPQAATPAPAARLDPPRVRLERRRLRRREVEAFAAGDTAGAFGAGFEGARAHTRSPRIPAERLLLLDEVDEIDTAGGPWGRGYLRARLAISPGQWFFPGHFHNDPCMPGTLMFEGALQAMSLYLAALGLTLDRDGWRFEPVPGESFPLRCQGQVIPASKELVCEVFVEEVMAGPLPTLYADLLGTVDGRKAFHCRRMGLRLVPDWPLDGAPLARLGEGQGAAQVAEVGGISLGYDALLACAWGRPSRAFGEMYAPFDAGRRVARLPGPPYHFMTRVREVESEAGGMQPGARVAVEYDVPPDAWYFQDGGAGTMPYCVLLEAALQPCGWLASFVGCALDGEAPGELFFRNLDGAGTLHAEIPPEVGTLRTEARLRSLSRASAVILVGFDVETWARDRRVFSLQATFGFFPAAALAGQAGLDEPAELRAWALDDDADADAIAPALDPRRPAGGLRLSGGRLLPFDRVTGYWPQGGASGLGRARAHKAIEAGQWPFRAHFFQDPVQPGSLGLQALLDLLRWTMIEQDLGRGLARPRFEPMALGQRMAWKFRGQVLPAHREVTTAVELREVGRDDRGVYAVGDGSLWVDGRRIYRADGLGMRIVDEEDPAPRRARRREEPDGLDVEGLRRHWCERVGLPRGWLGDDLAGALLRRYVRRLVSAHPRSLPTLAGRSVLYLANHQVQIESWLATMVLAYLGGRPVVAIANAKHRARWLGWLGDSLFACPGARDPQTVAYFEKSRPESLPGLLRGLGEDVRRRGSSILVHVEGTRQASCRQPTRQISSLLLDLALELELPIVPIRFTGGLPVEPVAEKLEFPWGHGAQDYHLGAPLWPEDLRRLGYAERRAHVLAAIDALGPDVAAALPHPPHAELARRVVERRVSTGADEVEATLMCVLAEEGLGLGLGDDARALLAAHDGEGLTLPDDPRGRWLAAIARRLFGPRGPRVTLGGAPEP